MAVSKNDLMDSLLGDMLGSEPDKGVVAEIREVGVKHLFPFKNHPFKVKDDDNFKSLKESIRKMGISEPIIVRARPGQTGYEIISGHRRSEAARQLGIEKVPVLVTNLDDDRATILMVDGNKKRDKLDPSEKAFAFKMRMEAEGHMRVSDGTGETTAVKIGKDYGVSERSVFNFIRLTELLPELIEAVDNRKLQMGIAVEVSYMDKDAQQVILDYFKSAGRFPDKEAIKALKEKGTITEEDVEKSMVSKDSKKSSYLDRFNEYFPDEYSEEDKLEVITLLLDGWKKDRLSGMTL